MTQKMNHEHKDGIVISRNGEEVLAIPWENIKRVGLPRRSDDDPIRAIRMSFEMFINPNKDDLVNKLMSEPCDMEFFIDSKITVTRKRMLVKSASVFERTPADGYKIVILEFGK